MGRARVCVYACDCDYEIPKMVDGQSCMFEACRGSETKG